MKTFSENFTSYSVNEWIQKAEKDLKGKSISELSWSWTDAMSFPPVYFESPSAVNLNVPSSQSPWTITEIFDIHSPAQSNQDILEALSMGLESIHLKLHKRLTLDDWNLLLDKVILTYIHLFISFTEEAHSLDTLQDYLQEKEWDKSKLSILTSDDSGLPSHLQVCQQFSANLIIQTDMPAKNLAKQMLHAEQMLQASKNAKRFIFNITLSKSFYHNIAGIQAAKIVWQNILDANGLDPNTPIDCIAHIQDEDELDENTQKINATIQAVSAVSCGVAYLIIHPKQTVEDQKFERRINRNIQHLLKLESYMDRVMNPTEGAYYFDHLTKELAEAIWSEFQSMS